MRKSFLRLCGKLNFRFCAAYTWLLRSSLKSCGRNVRIQFPVRLEEPGSISLGDDTFIYPRTWINAVSSWAGVKYQGEVKIGDRVGISYGVQISAAELIVIEDDVALSSGVVIVDHIHDYGHLGVPIYKAPLSKPSAIRIGKGSFLGVYCVIGPGVQIGEYAVVAANSVVVNNVPAYSIAIGNPARSVGFQSRQSTNSAGEKSARARNA